MGIIVGGGVMILVLTEKGIQCLDEALLELKLTCKALSSMKRIPFHIMINEAFKIYEDD